MVLGRVPSSSWCRVGNAVHGALCLAGALRGTHKVTDCWDQSCVLLEVCTRSSGWAMSSGACGLSTCQGSMGHRETLWDVPPGGCPCTSGMGGAVGAAVVMSQHNTGPSLYFSTASEGEPRATMGLAAGSGRCCPAPARH